MHVGRVLLPLLFVLPLTVADAAANTYYVRSDGGSATQCTGLVDAAYPGSGTAQSCAWNHPFRALPPGGSASIAGGDTLIIGAGSYKLGLNAPGADSCDAAGSYDCVMPPLPSGPSASQPTRILGAGYASGCANPPELWGSERPWQLIDLSNSSNVEIACLDLTDHSSCIEDHNQSGLPCAGCEVRCQRDSPPYGDWASAGIYARDSSNVLLRDLNIHGLAAVGIRAGRLSDWTLERIKIVANGGAGWDGDLGGGTDSSNSGDLVFRHIEVAWNGCSESYPGKSVTLDSCWGQEAGGYGDGFAAGSSGGKWVIEDSKVHHNTSDGIDFLYLTAGSDVRVSRLTAYGNAGNQLKVAGQARVENSLLIGDCASFDGRPLMAEGDNCRAAGNALSIDLHRGSAVTVINTTITGQGDCLVDIGCNDSMDGDSDPDCDGSELVTFRNTLYYGQTDWRQPWESTCLYWYDASLLPADPYDGNDNLVYGAKDDPCPGANDVCAQDPLLSSGKLASFDAHLQTGSPAIDHGTPTGAPSDDLERAARDAKPDIGAYEFGATPACSLSCSASVPATAQVGEAVAFAATATPVACSGTTTYQWTLGDGSFASGQNPSHTYASSGSFDWSLTAAIDSVQCVRSGTLELSAAPACVLDCTANAPATAQAGQAAAFTATVTATDCSESPAYTWDFGDGATSSAEDPSHSYATAGTYAWSFTASADGQSCNGGEQIVVSSAVKPPIIKSVTSLSGFRLRLAGSNFQLGAKVYIASDTTAWSNISRNSKGTQLTLGSGSALKKRFPRKLAVSIRVVNKDGGVASTTYTRP